ncbi:NADH-quinone oxidoreductase subunit NuoG [Nitrosomonas oligotropha]|uniref:NADH-quinone oxidoreductase n=1 Tax=Nitrosomonas oligotropha TaxID=42354 RepID=A0A1H8QUY5_9PROT|nr:NADH-quinone oxidoreductase subunit NuoG [Nitrosomonas oligotropha]SDW89050.1 NADH dehydrogenase subunit G [Nitrosomonas oligotropha]SEO57761.1 NADH dehydrogenase subunit G [Nitrosomonas oligotropha]
MVNIEIDGKQVSVPKGSTIMDGAKQIGVYIPHFCYHKKLSIAANCRMCLVQVEKAPKPLPACATPVMDGMKVYTHSQQAVTAQKGVMEFLLINHPLDCPICDQGGECQLQDLAVGYGASGSRYTEAKRVVVNKNLGPLISTDMTRCIHCTRCVRFGQEIAGIMELGMAGRGEHSEILAFVGKTIDSELSGNVIDLCPVGALVSKPFRYSARTWELSRRKSISPHCGLGSNLVVQVKQNRVMRVLPRDNEAINECWLSDKDRFSYEGLNSEDRLTRPMIKREGQWFECDWQEALEFTAHSLQTVKQRHGAKSLAALGSAHSTSEELYLLQKLIRAMGSGNIDHRLRQSDFRADKNMLGVPWLGTSIADISQLKSALIIGSTLRKDHPLIAQRMRQAVKNGMKLNIVNPVDDDLLVKVAHKAIVSPVSITRVLAEILKAAAEIKGTELTDELKQLVNSINIPSTANAFAIASSLIENAPAAIYLGNVSQHHPDYSIIGLLADLIARITGASYGVLGESANSVGAYLAGAIPEISAISIAAKLNDTESGLTAAQMLQSDDDLAKERCKAFILMNVEPEFDTYDSYQALKTIKSSEFVVSLTAYKGNGKDYADVLLPITPFTETSGTYVNTEGKVQSFNGVVSPLGEARPAWKVLRVLANLLELEKFDYETAEQVREEIFPADVEINQYLNNKSKRYDTAIAINESHHVQRIGEIPIYQADPIVRRAESLQATHDATQPKAWMPAAMLEKLGITAGDQVRIKQGEGFVQLEAAQDEKLPVNCVRIAGAHPKTIALGALFGEIVLEKL